jgi:hypothetical protein
MPKRHTQGRLRAAARPALALLLLLLPACAARALAQAEAPASVAGRVREGERGVAGLTVVVMSAEPAQRFRAVARARTDAEGRYRVGGIPPGRYLAAPAAPVYVLQDVTSFPPGKPFTLSAGDSVEDADFRVVRGGVITGRVTDADGNPLVAEPVNVTPADPGQNQRDMTAFGDQRDRSTDDRGVYRIYGLEPGRYRVSVGGDGRTLRAPGAKYYRRTFYPSAVEESQAKVVEVSAGEEADDVDITLGPPERTFRISGRFVSADTNRPVAVAGFGYGMVDPSTGRLAGDYSGGSTDARGGFQAAGLSPGRYKIFAYPSPAENADWYSDTTDFEVTDSDVSGLVVKLRRGSTVSGVVTVEGLADRAAATRLLAGVRVYGFADRGGEDSGGPGSYVRPVALAPDGGFRLTGVRPGRLRLSAAGDVKGLTLSRVELGGADQRGGIDIAEGAQVTGVRLVFVYGNAVLRGQLNFPGGGPPPAGARMVVVARRAGAGEGQGSHGVEADSRGRFQIEGLAAGEYEVQARAYVSGGAAFVSESQRVSVTDGGDVTVSLTLTASAPQGGRP